MTPRSNGGASLGAGVTTMANHRMRQPAERPAKRTTDLVERAKELRCLISVSRVLADRRSPIANVFERVVDAIPRGWRYPDLASVRLTWNDQQWSAPDFRVTPWTMVQPIGTGPQPVGVIEV